MSLYVISYEITPNDQAYKFLINHDFAGQIMWECSSLESAKESELAENIWSIGQVRQVFFHDNMVVVHKTQETNWDRLIPLIIQRIDEHFRTLKPLFKSNQKNTEDVSDERLELVRQIISDYIQPALASHGGFVRIVSFKDKILELSLHGACDGCPSADSTMEIGIKNLISFYYSDLEVKFKT